MLSEIFFGIVVLTQVNSELVFPSDFIFGAGTSAYQIEGAWDVDGKSESVWDHRTHNYPNQIKDYSNGDIAADSYYKFKEDIKLLRDLGVDSYRFSISWPRILPDGYANVINFDAIQHYNNIIDELLKYNITPVVTIFHWDLPYTLSLIGGWTNEALIDYYLDYARVVFQNFGDRVKIWTSFNEPQTFCSAEYSTALSYMNLNNPLAPYLCGHAILKAHGKVYQLYKNEFQGRDGKIGLAMGGIYVIPKTRSSEDIEAAERFRELDLNWFAHPVYSECGDYSPYLKNYLADVSKRENFPRSKLPVFTEMEIEEIRGSFDYLGFNHYGNTFVFKPQQSSGVPSFRNDRDVGFEMDPNWVNGDVGVPNDPKGFYNYLTYIKNRYDNPPVFIMENGYAEEALQDINRQNYFEGYLQALSDSIRDGSKVLGYFVWSLIDNFEWFQGYTVKYGLYHVDFTNATRPRTPRQSAIWYKNFIQQQKMSRSGMNFL